MAGRDMSVPYTEDEILDIVEKSKKYPTFDGHSISCKDFGPLCADMKFHRTKEQMDAFDHYYEKHLGGRLGLEEMKQLLRDHCSPSRHAGWYAKKFDLNKNGFIDKEEFEAVYALASVQWPQVSGKSYDDFVKEADTNKDGKVDIAELAAWLTANTKN